MPLIVLPKSCSCRCGPCPPPPFLVCFVCFLSFFTRFFAVLSTYVDREVMVTHYRVAVGVQSETFLRLFGTWEPASIPWATTGKYPVPWDGQCHAAGFLRQGGHRWTLSFSFK